MNTCVRCEASKVKLEEHLHSIYRNHKGREQRAS